jgi:hypothetical protein
MPETKLSTITKNKNEIGASGTVIVGGIISDSDYNLELTGERGIKLIDKMIKGDATVKAALLAVVLPILSAHWFVQAGGEDEIDQKVARFVEQNLFEEMSITWQEFLRQSSDYLPYGHFVWEKVFKDVEFEGGKYIGLDKMAARLPGTIWAWELKDKRKGIRQFTVEKGEVEIPIEKLLILTNEKRGDNWLGVSLLRSAYKHWYIKENLYKIDAIAHERQGLGIPYVRKPNQANPKDKAKAKELLQNLRANEQGYLEIPTGWEIGFLDMKSGTTRDPQNSIKHHDRQIVKSVLAQFLELGATSTGSYALSADQTDLFMLALHHIARTMRDAVQKYVIQQLVDMNFPNVKNYPTLEFEKIGTVSFDKLSTALQRLIQTGVLVPDDELEEYVRNVMDLPEKAEGTDLPDDFGQDMALELEGELASLDSETEPAPETPEDEQVMEDLAQANELLMAAAGVRGPLGDDHKKKISEALQRYWASRKKGKQAKGKKGKKAKDPVVEQSKAEIAQLRQELADFRDSARRMVLEKKAKGEKLDPQEQAKAQLELLDKKQAINKKINDLKIKIAERKSQAEAQAAKPAVQKAMESFRGFLASFRDSIEDTIHGNE